MLGVTAALLVACSTSGGGLIPAGNAGPLKSDFAEVEQAARSGDGNCTATEAAIAKTERDFTELPASVDAGLRRRVHEGISALHQDALKLCGQPLPQTTATGTSAHTTATTTSTATTTPTHTATTETAPTTSSTTTTPGVGGGTQAPPSEAQSGQGGGVGAGEGKGATEGKAGASGSEGAGAGGRQEGGK